MIGFNYFETGWFRKEITKMSTRRKILWLFAVTLLAGVGTLKAEWTEPVFHGELTHPDGYWMALDPALSNDETIIYFRCHDLIYDENTIWEAHRDETEDTFTGKRVLTEIFNDGEAMGSPWATENGLHLYYYQWSGGECYIKMAERATTDDTWTHVKTFDEIHTAGIGDSMPTLTGDELTMFYMRTIGGKKYIWKATRPTIEEPFSDIEEVSELNDSCNTVSRPSILPDGLTIYYDAQDGSAPSIYKATRSSTDEPFGNIEVLDFCLPDKGESHPYVAPDGTGFYFFGGWGVGQGGIWEIHWVDPYNSALQSIEDAIAKKIKAIEIVNAAIDKEMTALEALQELTAGGEYGELGLRRIDIFRARIRIILSMLRQRRARAELRKGLRELERALVLLGANPAPQDEVSSEAPAPGPLRLRIGR